MARHPRALKAHRAFASATFALAALPAAIVWLRVLCYLPPDLAVRASGASSWLRRSGAQGFALGRWATPGLRRGLALHAASKKRWQPKLYSAGDKLSFFASCPGGLEPVLADEVRECGAEDVKVGAQGVYFSASPQVGCRVLVLSRTASALDEILVERMRPLKNINELYRLAANVLDWPSVMLLNETLRTKVSRTSGDVASEIRHTKQSAITLAMAVTDAFQKVLGSRPNVSLDSPDWALHATLSKYGATLARRWSGFRPMHRRGYREDVKMHKAAIHENVAAGLLLLAGIRPGESLSLLDPMCGSGTFVLEASMIAANVAPGLVREELCTTRWHAVPRQYQNLLRQELVNAWNKVQVPSEMTLRGSDIFPGALALARRCVHNLNEVVPGLGTAVDYRLCDAADAEAPAAVSGSGNGKTLICCNPPWGDRLGDTGGEGFDDNLQEKITSEAWKALSGLVRRHKGQAWVLTPYRALAAELGSPKARRRIDGGATGSRSTGLEWLRFDCEGEDAAEASDAMGAPKSAVTSTDGF